jgi:Glycosyl hydrolase family 63 C-terminal domain
MSPATSAVSDVEQLRLKEDAARTRNWKRWGPYLAERQWGTVREDYSANGDGWRYFTFDHSHARAYRWGEDGLLGFTDRECRLCFAPVLWNERDPVLKERLYGLNGPEGNHGEDVKECYYYLDALPTHCYMKALYKYTQRGFPYEDLLAENERRGRLDPEYEITDTDAFAEDRYFDVLVEYAKASPDDVLIRLTITNNGPEAAPLHLLPTLWFRNTWAWGSHDDKEDSTDKPRLWRTHGTEAKAVHPTLGEFRFCVDVSSGAAPSTLLFTENETNYEKLWNVPNKTRYTKDAFHRAIIHGDASAVNPECTGTKMGAHVHMLVAPGETRVVRCRLTQADEARRNPFGSEFEGTFEKRIAETNAYYDATLSAIPDDEGKRVARQAYAGLLWSKQFYHYAVRRWLEGDPAFPPPPPERWSIRNAEWTHLYNSDVISMPDKWEYPWYAAWDLAFHTIPLARVDPNFAKQQLVLLLREWYMHPNGQIPAYEFAFDDVNPPVHAWAVWRVYKMTGKRGERDRVFLGRCFHKLLLNFTWWVNRKDRSGNNLFEGGFLGLDNIGLFDRSKPFPGGGYLEQADGTSWMAFYCATMLSIALELAAEDPAYEDVASKFFEHFVAIADAINTVGGNGLWDEQDGFYYDQLHVGAESVPVRVRSLVGIIPLLACENIEWETLEHMPGFKRRMQWFLENRPEIARHSSYMESFEGDPSAQHTRRLLAIPTRERLEKVLQYVLDENEFLSERGIRSVSRVHRDHPAIFRFGDTEYRVDYEPAESTTGLFGGNSNWRGPIWFPINYLLLEALERYHHFYGDTFVVECPTGSGKWMTLSEVSRELARRLTSIFLPDSSGARPCHGADRRYAEDPNWRELVLFHEYFHGDTGRGCGASHQTGWTALVIRCLETALGNAPVHRRSVVVDLEAVKAHS